MSVENTVAQAGEYDFEYCELLLAGGAGIDITNQVDTLYVYEDIHSSTITGTLMIRDTHDIMSKIGRSGMDLLSFSVRTKSIGDTETLTEKQRSMLKLQGKFHIYKHGDRTMVKDRTQLYVLYFHSVISMIDINNSISRAFQGTGTDIAKRIFDEYYPEKTPQGEVKYGRELFVENSTRSIKFVSNYWTPLKCIAYAAANSVSAQGDPAYLFYENRAGYNIRSISSIAKDPIHQEFSDNDFTGNIDKAQGRARRNPIEDYKTVQAIRVDATFDYIKDASAGALSSTLYTYDLLQKKIDKKVYKSSLFTARNSIPLNENPLYTPDIVNASNPALMFSPRNWNGQIDLTDSAYIQERVSRLHLLNTSKIEIDVFGRTDYTVGQVVSYFSNVKAPITDKDTSESYEDGLLSGKYIVTAISHRFNREAYMCTLELSKESSRLK